MDNIVNKFRVTHTSVFQRNGTVLVAAAAVAVALLSPITLLYHCSCKEFCLNLSS